MTKEELKLRFDPHTIEHLGIKMYSQLPYALAELVANAYDAGAENVIIRLYDENPENKRIIVSDDGEGMSFDEIRDNFLVIGRRRRDEDESRDNLKGRKITALTRSAVIISNQLFCRGIEREILAIGLGAVDVANLSQISLDTGSVDDGDVAVAVNVSGTLFVNHTLG